MTRLEVGKWVSKYILKSQFCEKYLIQEWSGGGIFAPPFLGVEKRRGAEHIFWSGVKKGVSSKILGAFTSLMANWSHYSIVKGIKI